MDDWERLTAAARRRLRPRRVSPFVEAGGVAAALLTADGEIYTGVCIDTACSLGMCAERNAVANMLTCGGSRIVKLVCLTGNGIPELPCGACRELLMQLDPAAAEIEILTAYPRVAAVRLGELLPDWWGKGRFELETGCFGEGEQEG